MPSTLTKIVSSEPHETPFNMKFVNQQSSKFSKTSDLLS